MPPPVRNAAATREAILMAAKQRFLRESYDTVALRDVAGDVGVDVSLIGRYFGSKEKLFRAVLSHGKARLDSETLTAQDLPAYMASLAFPSGAEADCGHIERLQIILRSASSAKASEIVHNSFREDVLAAIVAILPGDDAELRVTLAMSVLTGTTVMRAIMGVNVLCQCDGQNVRGHVEELLTAALFGRAAAA